MKKKLLTGLAGVIAGTALFLGGIVAAGGDGDEADETPGVTPAAIGPRISESDYVAVTPCRLFDTRQVAAGAFENEVRHFDARGGLAGQGGAAGGCAIPAWANGIVVTITGVTPTGKGFMRGKAFDGGNSLPTATQLNYAPSIDASNTLTLPIAQGLSKEFSLGTFGNRVHLVGDVLGFYADPFYASVDGVDPGISFIAEKRFNSITRNSEGNYTLTVDASQDIRGCAVAVTNGTTDDSRDLSGFADDVTTAVVDINSPTSFDVETLDSAGVNQDTDFVVSINC